MFKRLSIFLLAIILMGTGCTAALDDSPDVSITEIEAEYGLDLPDDSTIYSYTPIPGYFNVIAFTETPWEELRDDLHEQLIEQGYDDTISIETAEPTEDQPLIGSYLKSSEDGSGAIVSRAVTIGVENGQTKYSILKN